MKHWRNHSEVYEKFKNILTTWKFKKNNEHAIKSKGKHNDNKHEGTFQSILSILLSDIDFLNNSDIGGNW